MFWHRSACFAWQTIRGLQRLHQLQLFCWSKNLLMREPGLTRFANNPRSSSDTTIPTSSALQVRSSSDCPSDARFRLLDLGVGSATFRTLVFACSGGLFWVSKYTNQLTLKKSHALPSTIGKWSAKAPKRNVLRTRPIWKVVTWAADAQGLCPC